MGFCLWLYIACVPTKKVNKLPIPPMMKEMMAIIGEIRKADWTRPSIRLKKQSGNLEETIHIIKENLCYCIFIYPLSVNFSVLGWYGWREYTIRRAARGGLGFFIAIKLMALNVDKMNGRVMQKKLLFILASSFFLVKEWGPCHFFKPNSTK